VDNLISLVLSGGVSGAIYSLLGVGLVLTYSTSKIFNFGHAATAFACAYLYYQLESGLGWPMLAALFVTVFLFAPLSGLMWNRLVFRRLAGASEAAGIVAGVGVLVVMPALMLMFVDVLKNTFGVGFLDTSAAYQVPGVGPNPPKSWHITHGFVLNSDQLIVLVVGAAAFFALWALLRHTNVGLRMRASVDRPDLARLRGTNANRISSLAWVLSFFLAGLAGVLAAPFPGPFGLAPDNYTFALFVAATAAVIGGLRSIPVAFAAGLVLGSARSLAEGYVSGQYLGGFGRWVESVYGLRSSLPYLVLFVVLVVMGSDRKRRVAGTSSEAAPPPDHLADLSPWRRRLPWIIASAVLLTYTLGPADEIWRSIVLSGLAMGIVFMSFTIVTGIGGMVSLAQSTFVAVAALTAGLALAHGWPFLPALLIGVAAAAVIGCVVALPAIRLGGLSLTLMTLALALLGGSVLFNIQGLTNGSLGWTVRRPKLGPLDLSHDRTMIVVLMLLVVAVAAMVGNLEKSASGRAMAALRSTPVGAAASGVPIGFTKLMVFVVSAGLAGFGGVLLASVNGNVSGTSFPPVIGFLWLAVVVVFGAQRPQGAVVAGLVFAALPRLIAHGIHVGGFGWGGTTSTLLPPLFFGLGAIGLAKHPHGLLSQLGEVRHRRRQRRRGYPDRAAVATISRISTHSTAEPRPIAPAPSGPPPLLELRNLHSGYGAVDVLHDISLAVEPGTVLAVLGANGAGKSTLCSTVAGLLPVASGTLWFRGEDISSLSVYERARKGIVLVPESRGIFPGLTVEENLKMWLTNSSERESVYDRFPQLATRRRITAANLSGGEQQMLSLAPLIAKPPAILIADEPTLGLAVKTSAQVIDALQVLRAEGTTLLLVEEKAREVMGIADAVGLLTLGRLQWVREPSAIDVLQLTSAYLGSSSSTSLTPQPARGAHA
jgi:ABC-type branched-subunit amino acid transport system ATPase component/branched-subunit amino acid ABC-type transport system permease component